MNEETQDVLARAGQELLTWLQATGDLVTEQAPLLAEEIVLRGMVHHSTGAVWALLWVVFGVFALKYGMRWITTANK
ncbi:MAG: hypothetical protein V3S71_06450, partial [Acidobacteriota bacterium]